MTNKPNNWEEDFDRKWFKWEIEEQNCSWSSTDSDELKAFFKSYVNQLLQSEKEEWKRQVMEIVKKYKGDACYASDDIINLIRQLN